MNLKKKIEILGLEIPAVFIALAMIGGLASAATLSYFATVEGEADVTQAIVIEEEDEGAASLTYENFDGGATGGETVVDGPYTAQNNMDEDYTLTFESHLVTEDYDDTSTNMEIGWGDTGLHTTYVDAFAGAGHEGYEAPDEDDCEVVGSFGDIDDDDEYYCVEAGDYTDEGEIVIEVDDVTVASLVDDERATIDSLNIKADGVTVKGFEVIPEDEVDGNNLIDAQNSGKLTIKYNLIDGQQEHLVAGEGEPDRTGIYLENEKDSVIEHNTIEGNFAGIGGTEDFRGTIRYNVIRNNDEGIGVGDGQDFETYGNRFKDNEASFRLYGSESYTLDAEDNFFYEPFNIDTSDNEDAEVDASYKVLDPTVPAGGELWFGAVNEFDVMVSGEYSYDLSTEIS